MSGEEFIDCQPVIAGKPGSHRVQCLWLIQLADTKQMWERACPRRRWISQHIWRLKHRFREQARSHTFFNCGASGTAVHHIN
ncbi:hypothetical protein DJ480_09300 [Pseudomonas sp. Leaf98]|nr:hypothetical protein DJ480_09300 [Pseudomonas sp. Leaf98]